MSVYVLGEKTCPDDLTITTTTTTTTEMTTISSDWPNCPYGLGDLDTSYSYFYVDYVGMLIPGNGVCEDEVNIPECGYDGGDCCNENAACGCTDCTCHQTGSQSVECVDTCPETYAWMIG